MLIYCVTHRHYAVRPHQCADHIVGYYSTIEKARAVVKDFLGEEATCDNDFGFDCWVTPHLPNTEYLIDVIKVW
jgi:hypothetical protein